MSYNQRFGRHVSFTFLKTWTETPLFTYLQCFSFRRLKIKCLLNNSVSLSLPLQVSAAFACYKKQTALATSYNVAYVKAKEKQENFQLNSLQGYVKANIPILPQVAICHFGFPQK